MARRYFVLLLTVVLVCIGCSNSPITADPEPQQQTEQPAPISPAPTEAAVAIPVKQPVEELAASGELDNIASIAPAEELAESNTNLVASETAQDQDNIGLPVSEQDSLEAPGRAEPPRPDSAESEDPAAPTQPLIQTVTEPNVRVGYFRFAGQPEKPSEPTTIEWQVEGVDSVQITRFGGQYGEAGEQWTVPAAGSMEHTFPPTTAGFEVTYLLSTNNNQSVVDQFNVTVPCEYNWVIDFRDPSLLCPGRPVVSNAAFQVFEGGVMMWFEETGTILYSNWDGTISAELPDTYVHGTDPITDPAFTAPSGYYQPDYGLGKVWRSSAEARIALGWAITPNIGYEAIRQGEPIVPFGGIDELVSLPDDGFLHKRTDGPWEVSYALPEITLAGIRPPVAEGEMPTPEPEADPQPIVKNGVTVNYFRFNPPPARPTDQVMLEWDVSGVSAISIERVGGKNGEANEIYTNLPASGSLNQTFPLAVSGLPVLYTLRIDEGEPMAIDFVINMPCEYDWAITDVRDAGCPTRPVVSFGAQQDFENGFMVWIEEENKIIYSNYEGTRHGVVSDTYVHDVDLVSDPSLTPPAGMIQPDYGFGKVWRTIPGARDLLGWAITPAFDYEVRHQTSVSEDDTFVEFVTLRNGGRIIIQHPDPTWIIEYQ